VIDVEVIKAVKASDHKDVRIVCFVADTPFSFKVVIIDVLSVLLNLLKFETAWILNN
jgi:hypothetical protein